MNLQTQSSFFIGELNRKIEDFQRVENTRLYLWIYSRIKGNGYMSFDFDDIEYATTTIMATCKIIRSRISAI